MTLTKYAANLWILRNASIALRVARGFFRALVLRRNTLKVIELYPTFHCQSGCRMCSVKKYDREGAAALSLADYEGIARDGARLGAIAMVLLGGEPSLSPDAIEIIRIFKRHGYFVTMVSNALSLTGQKLEEYRHAGLDSIYFSLESLDAGINDEIRGAPGHFAAVMQAITAARSCGLLVGLAGVIVPGQVERFEQLLRFCEERGLLASGGEIATVGAAEGQGVVSDEEHAVIAGFLRRYPRLTFDWGLSYFLRPQCPAGKEKIGVTCYGDVIGCSLTPIMFGNIRNEALERIWRRMGSFSAFRKNADRCLAACDRAFITRYLRTIHDRRRHPVVFTDHPGIQPESEPELFRDLPPYLTRPK